MAQCKNCNSESIIKSCLSGAFSVTNTKDCGVHFIEGDRRYKRETAAKKALCVILYSLGKASFSMLGKILNHSPSIIYRWVV